MRMPSLISFSALVLMSGAVAAADLQVASHVANIPFEYEDQKQDGKIVGFEVDIIEAVAKRLGKKVEYTSMPFHSLFSAVQSGRADVALGTISITDKRLESVAFTQPWMDSQQCITVDATSDFKNLDDLIGKQVAVQTGTVGAAAVEKWAKEAEQKSGNSTEVRGYEDNVGALLDVRNKRVDALIHDCPMDQYYIKDKKNADGSPMYKIIGEVRTDDRLAPMFNKNSPLVAQFDEQISEMKKAGEIDKIYQKWFGTPANPESSTVKVLPIPTLSKQ